MPNQNIKRLIAKSRQVIADCCLKNGAIVASNSDNLSYPNLANNYRYVWGRDASFILYAAKILELKNIETLFVDWLLKRAQNFSQTGIIWQRYNTNGSLELGNAGKQYQPDQTGALIWALAQGSNFDKKTKKVIKLLSDSLCCNWQKTNFSSLTYDLWEEKRTIPTLKDNFLYTLATCSYGLKLAGQILGNKKYLAVSQQMQKIIANTSHNFYPRLWGKIPDKRIDASVMGLIWPFKAKASKKLNNSLKMIEKKLLTPQGIIRYEGDDYDGVVEDGQHWKKGAGAWPLLTFWYFICLAKSGQKNKARNLFVNYSKNFKNGYIPEQLFNNKIQKSVSPLGWSQAMFIAAASELGFLK